MLTIRELRAMRAHMTADAFSRQLGPFVLIKKPDDVLESQKAMTLGAGSTFVLPARGRSLAGMSLLFEFDELEVATLPPMEGNDTLTVGRLPDSDLVVDHTSVSKRHAQLRWAQAQCQLFDLGSTNGTWVNDAPLRDRAARLNDGDIIAFGDVRFAFLHTASLYRVMNAPPRHTPSLTPAVRPVTSLEAVPLAAAPPPQTPKTQPRPLWGPVARPGPAPPPKQLPLQTPPTVARPAPAPAPPPAAQRPPPQSGAKPVVTPAGPVKPAPAPARQEPPSHPPGMKRRKPPGSTPRRETRPPSPAPELGPEPATEPAGIPHDRSPEPASGRSPRPERTRIIRKKTRR